MILKRPHERESSRRCLRREKKGWRAHKAYMWRECGRVGEEKDWLDEENVFKKVGKRKEYAVK